MQKSAETSKCFLCGKRFGLIATSAGKVPVRTSEGFWFHARCVVEWRRKELKMPDPYTCFMCQKPIPRFPITKGDTSVVSDGFLLHTRCVDEWKRAYPERVMEQPKRGNIAIAAGFIGGLTFAVLNIALGGAVPGGALGGLLGFFCGAIVGKVLEDIIISRKSS